MGMYTQYRGWLCLDSICGENEEKAKAALAATQATFNERKDISRPWVCNDAWIHSGGNGSLWLFIGTEHKDYDESMDEWIKTVVALFPNCEGRIDVQYEETSKGEETPVYLVDKGTILKTEQPATTSEAYGLDFKLGGRNEG